MKVKLVNRKCEMIKPTCDIKGCGKELDDFGAIILSPPNGELVLKKHICKKCYFGKIAKLLNGYVEPSIPAIASNVISER